LFGWKQLLRDLDDAERRTEDDQKGVCLTLKRQLAEKDTQLQEARRKQEEAKTHARVSAKNEARLRQLTEEIGIMKRQKVSRNEV